MTYTIISAIGIPVGAVVIVTTAALLLIVLWKCKRTTKGTASSTSDCNTTLACNNYDSSLSLLFTTLQWNLLKKMSIQRGMYTNSSKCQLLVANLAGFVSSQPLTWRTTNLSTRLTSGLLTSSSLCYH